MNDVKALRSLLIASLLAAASTAAAQDANPWKFEFHGFVTGSMFMQNQVFAGGTGQDNLLLAPVPANEAGGKLSTLKSDSFLGADVRQSRWIFAMTGPQAFGATPKAYFEGDFYGQSTALPTGGTNNPTTNAVTLTFAGGQIEHTQARLRAAYGELKWGNTQLQIGQYSAQLILAQLSASVAHIANPITFGTGTIGGRAMGVRVIHAVPLGDNKVELAGEVLASKYNDPVRPAVSQAWASKMPSLGARATLSGKAGALSYSGYVAGIYETVDLKGFGDPSTGTTLADGTGPKTSISPYAVEVGGRIAYSLVNVAGNFYTGNGTGAWAGALNQLGDVDGGGFWAQLGVTPHKMVGIYGLYGMGWAGEKNLRKWNPLPGTAPATTLAGRTDNTLYGGILRISDGGYTFAAEYYAMQTKWITGRWADYQAGGTTKPKTDAYQLIVSGHYAF